MARTVSAGVTRSPANGLVCPASRGSAAVACVAVGSCSSSGMSFQVLPWRLNHSLIKRNAESCSRGDPNIACKSRSRLSDFRVMSILPYAYPYVLTGTPAQLCNYKALAVTWPGTLVPQPRALTSAEHFLDHLDCRSNERAQIGITRCNELMRQHVAT